MPGDCALVSEKIKPLQAEALGPQNLRIVHKNQLGKERDIVTVAADAGLKDIIDRLALEEDGLRFDVVTYLNSGIRGDHLQAVERAKADCYVLDQ
ncbi:hypothetical protein [Rhizobium sp. 2MFCol3.1]|uniref:hypothetical protein n=1 Tax=Rhizobium sp. 2MFCol3.1 TaxID=1246459 RepID=UPI000375F1FB|nr:hypothetical protein [Rhizobium sp. 2MFCol3.1]